MRDFPECPVVDCRGSRPLLLVVEGSHDASFLMIISRILAVDDPAIPDLQQLTEAGEVIVVPFGGGNPLPWSDRFAPLRCAEVHLCDRELPPESAFRQLAAERVNRRRDCRAFLTTPRALENYLHPAAITDAGGVSITIGPNDCVATELARQSSRQATGQAWPDRSLRERQKHIQRTKRWLNTVAVKHMTPRLLTESDPSGDILHWLVTIRSMLSPDRQTLQASNCGRSSDG